MAEIHIDITEKLVSVRDEEVIGFLISAGGQYKVAVTKAFGVEHDIPYIDIAQWFSVPELSVVPIGKTKYAMCDRSLGFVDELKDTPVEDLGGTKVYYGYMFRDQHIVPMDSQAAFDRMIKEANGDVIE